MQSKVVGVQEAATLIQGATPDSHREQTIPFSYTITGTKVGKSHSPVCSARFRNGYVQEGTQLTGQAWDSMKGLSGKMGTIYKGASFRISSVRTTCIENDSNS